MSTFILATVGSSTLINVRRGLDLPDDCLPDERQVVGFLRQRDPADRICGAEINSISHLLNGQQLSVGRVGPPASLHLLVSDTTDGAWSGRVLQQYFRKRSGIEAVEWETVPGLNGDDARSFAHRGLRSLVKLAAKHLKQARERDPAGPHVIDATGGYKAQISLAGLIGQALKVPVVYLFERFPHCIEMPPMPVDFDRSLWIEHYWLFHWLSEEALLPAHRVRRSDVDPSLWDLLDRETVDDTEYLALSPVLELMHQGFDLLPPTDLTPPPDSGRDPQSKLHINEDHMHHAPHGSRERLDRLAQLPWVTLVEPITYENTAVAGRVKTGGTATLDEIYVVHGDGEKGLKIRLRTTCRTNAERLWCLEQLKLEMTR